MQDVLTYPPSRFAEALHIHKLTLKQGRVIKRYHIVFFAMGFFVLGIFILGEKFTLGVILARFFDALGDLCLDRGAGEL